MEKNARPFEPEKIRISLIILITIALPLAIASSAYTAEFPLSLNYNFNGMAHNGEAGSPDSVNGYRSISDRGLIIDGGPDSFGDIASPASQLGYDIVDTADTRDIVYLGNRNTVGGVGRPFDSVVDGDDTGIQPAWLQVVDQNSVSTPVFPALILDSGSQIGILYNISNGGGDFDVTLNFSDASSVTVTLNGPDWFCPSSWSSCGAPDPAGNGVLLQQNLGRFTGSRNVDLASPDAHLVVTEAIIDATELLNDLSFDVSGRRLTDITIDNRVSDDDYSAYAILAVTVTGSVAPASAIPTMNEFGIVILSLLLGSYTVWYMRKQSYREHMG